MLNGPPVTVGGPDLEPPRLADNIILGLILLIVLSPIWTMLLPQHTEPGPKLSPKPRQATVAVEDRG